MRLSLPIILFAATFCFALGIVLPLIRIDRFVIFSDEPSLSGLVAGLWASGDMLLATVVATFSIALPALKLAFLHCAAYGGPGARFRLPAWLHGLSRWSMLDVVLVALVIFAAKTSGLASAVTRPGLWFFAASVALTAAATVLLGRRPRG